MSIYELKKMYDNDNVLYVRLVKENCSLDKYYQIKKNIPEIILKPPTAILYYIILYTT